MNNGPPDPARGYEGQRRRFPWLTAEDMRILAALPPDAATEFEAFIRQQAASNRRYAKNVTSIGSPRVLTSAYDERAARWTYGTGGGRIHHETHREDG